MFAIGTLSSKVLSFLLIPVYTRYLSPFEFGTADLIIMSAGLVLPILTLASTESILRLSMTKELETGQVFSLGLGVICLGFLILMLFYPIFNSIEGIRKYSFLFYSFYITQALYLYLSSFLKGQKKVALIAGIGVLHTATLLLSNIVFLVMWRFGVNGLLYSYIVANTVSSMLLFSLGGVKEFLRSLNTIDKSLVLECMSFSLPLIPNRLSWWLNNSSNRYILSVFSSTDDVGLFSAASRLPSLLTAFQSVFIQAWQLSAIEELAATDRAAYFSEAYKRFNTLLILISALLISMLNPLVSILFGSEYQRALELVPFQVFAVVFGSLVGFLNSIHIAFGKTKLLLSPVLIGAIAGLLINIALISSFGIIIVAFSSFFSYFVIWFINLRKTLRYLPLSILRLNDFLSYGLVFLQCFLTICNIPSYFHFIVVMGVFLLQREQIFLVFNERKMK